MYSHAPAAEYVAAGNAYSRSLEASDRQLNAEEATYAELMSACQEEGARITDTFPRSPEKIICDFYTKKYRPKSLGETLAETLDYKRDFSNEQLVQIIINAANGQDVQSQAWLALDQMARIHAEYNTP